MSTFLTAEQFALNPLQWVTARHGTGTVQAPDGSDDFADPGFLTAYDSILSRVADAGFPAVMLKVPQTQTIPSYRAMVARHGLRLAPGYVGVPLPEDEKVVIAPQSRQWFHWFDQVRRRAEESLLCGLDRVFIAAAIATSRHPRVDQAAAVGFAYDPSRLQRMIDVLGTAVESLGAEGVRAGLHNHVGTWIETEAEIEAVLVALPNLWCGFDIGHLVWAGIDPVAMVSRHRDRVIDLHIKDMDLDVAAACRATATSYQSASARRLFREPGLGGIDLVGTLAQLPASFSGTVIVEVDRPSMDPDASARTSWRWVLDHYPLETIRT